MAAVDQTVAMPQASIGQCSPAGTSIPLAVDTRSSKDRWLLMRLLAAGGNASPRLAERLIDEYGSLGAVLAISDERLQQLGADANGVAMLQLIREALGAVIERRADERIPVRSSAQIADRLHYEMAWLTIEQVRVVFLDVGRRLQRIEILSTGTLHKAHFHAREIARRALELSAAAVILAHNHPSGDPTPSPVDIAATNKVRQALSALEIELLDHLVITRSRIVSMAASGYISMA